jgi:hypothetical protein
VLQDGKLVINLTRIDELNVVRGQPLDSSVEITFYVSKGGENGKD